MSSSNGPPGPLFTFPDGPDNTYDPYNQTVSFFQPNGTEIIIPFEALNDWQNYLTQADAVSGACVAASFVLMLALLFATRPDKRKNLLFVLNVLSLFFNFMSTLLGMLFYTSPATQFYNWFTFQSGPDWTNVNTSNAVAAVIINYLCYCTLEASLFMQTYVVCKTLKPWARWTLVTLSGLLVLGFMAFRLAFAVFNVEIDVAPTAFTPGYTYPSYEINLLLLPAFFLFSVTVLWFTAIFTMKLGLAIWQRRKIGVKNFGPLEIVFVMGCQSMIIPTIFVIFQFIFPVDFFNVVVRTLACLSLPLSTIWATANADDAPKVPFTRADHRAVKAKPVKGPAAQNENANGTASGSAGDSTVVATSPTAPMTPKKNNAGSEGTPTKVVEHSSPVKDGDAEKGYAGLLD